MLLRREFYRLRDPEQLQREAWQNCQEVKERRLQKDESAS